MGTNTMQEVLIIHDTEDYGLMKHKIQDLIDDKIIDFNSPEKSHMANVMYHQKGRNERNLYVEAVLQQRRKPDVHKRQSIRINISLAQALQILLRILALPLLAINSMRVAHTISIVLDMTIIID